MAVFITEKHETQPVKKGETDDTELVFNLTGSDDPAEMYAALLGEVASTVVSAAGATLQRQEINITYEAPEVWTGRVTYSKKTPSTVNVTFETSGGTAHITQSKETIARYVASGSATNFYGAIGVTEDGVEGCEITVPIYNWTETYHTKPELIDDAYIDKIYELTGKTNNDTYRNKAEGEVLFLGAAGTQRGDEDFEITFHYAAQKNADGLTVGGISGISKPGWAYLWIRYKDSKDATTGRMVKKPIQVNVERVYDAGDFSDLTVPME